MITLTIEQDIKMKKTKFKSIFDLYTYCRANNFCNEQENDFEIDFGKGVNAQEVLKYLKTKNGRETKKEARCM